METFALLTEKEIESDFSGDNDDDDFGCCSLSLCAIKIINIVVGFNLFIAFVLVVGHT